MVISLYIIVAALAAICSSEKIRFISTEHPNITYFNPNYFASVNFTSRRYGRYDPIYYVSIESVTVVYFDKTLKADFWFYEFLSNRYRRSFVEMHFTLCDLIHNDPFFGAPMKQGNLTMPCPYPPVDFYFYEWLTNRYKRSFVEMHFKWCDLMHKDPFFGAALRQGKFALPCPHMPGDYHAYNMSIPLHMIPPNFPFTKGRIIANITTNDKKDILAYGHIDMEIKEVRLRKKKGP